MSNPTKFTLGTQRQYLSGDKVVLDNGRYFVCLVNAGYIVSEDQPTHPLVNFNGTYWAEVSVPEIYAAVPTLAPGGSFNQPAPVSPSDYTGIYATIKSLGAGKGLAFTDTDCMLATEVVLYNIWQELNTIDDVSTPRTYKSGNLIPGISVVGNNITFYRDINGAWIQDLATDATPSSTVGLWDTVKTQIQQYQHPVHFRPGTSQWSQAFLEVLGACTLKAWLDAVCAAIDLSSGATVVLNVGAPLSWMGYNMYNLFSVNKAPGFPAIITTLY